MTGVGLAIRPLTWENGTSRRGALTPPAALTHPSDLSGRRAGVSLPSSEQWRPIPGYEGLYDVSDQGRVKSLARIDRAGRQVRERILKPSLHSEYPMYHLWANGRGRTYRLHSLIMLAFVGPLPEGREVRHLDGDSTNNTLANLVYGTPSENQLDKVQHGTHQQARKTHCPQGHEYSGENLKLAQRQGRIRQRYCRECHRLRSDQRRRDQGAPRRGPKTHCPAGHPYSDENTYTSPDGRRMCRICRRAAQQASEARRRGQVTS